MMGSTLLLVLLAAAIALTFVSARTRLLTFFFPLLFAFVAELLFGIPGGGYPSLGFSMLCYALSLGAAAAELIARIGRFVRRGRALPPTDPTAQ